MSTCLSHMPDLEYSPRFNLRCVHLLAGIRYDYDGAVPFRGKLHLATRATRTRQPMSAMP